MTAPTGARFHRDQRHHRRLSGQWHRDLRQLRTGAREWAGAAVDAVGVIVQAAGYVVARALVVLTVMGAGR